MTTFPLSPSVVFDGYQFAQAREIALAAKVAALREQGMQLRIRAVLFSQDAGSRLYTRLKAAAAQRVGIAYAVTEFSLTDDPSRVVAFLQETAGDQSVTGVIVQKPWRQTWLRHQEATSTNEDFLDWWHAITAAIAPHQDVDGLSPQTLSIILNGTWQESKHVLPATCRAVLTILAEVEAKTETKLQQSNIAILGRSELLGIPLAAVLRQKSIKCDLLGKSEFSAKIESTEQLQNYDVIVTATGRRNLVTGAMLREKVVIVDAGEPHPDVEWQTVASKASFITPVPGGVGPMTVVSLLENCVELAQHLVV